MWQNNSSKKHFLSSVLPACVFGCLSGIAASLTVTLFKWCAGFVISASEFLFSFVRQHLLFFIPTLFLLLAAALFLQWIYRREPDLQGGGIPASIGALRGLYPIHAKKSVIGVFLLSLLSFLLGVPLGTEGPAVQMGTAAGSGIVKMSPKKWKAWERASMTGGASAGFAVATGAPLSALLFSIEEAHRRLSPPMVLTCLFSVLSAGLVTDILSPLLGVSTTLFSLSAMPPLPSEDLWIPMLTGLFMGGFALLFLRGYRFLKKLLTEKGRRISSAVKIFAVLFLTLILGLLNPSFVSTGHHFITHLFESSPGVLMLLAIVAVRSILTLSANLCGITGGIFLPLMAIGAALAGTEGGLLLALGASDSFFPLILSLGICGCIAGMMKMPFTAILFGVEALGLSSNLLPLILTCAIAFALPEIFGEESISEAVLSQKEASLFRGKKRVCGNVSITVSKDSFAVGKEIHDIFWPNGVRILSVDHLEKGTLFAEGDTLTLYYSTCDPEEMRRQLAAITQSPDEI